MFATWSSVADVKNLGCFKPLLVHYSIFAFGGCLITLNIDTSSPHLEDLHHVWLEDGVTSTTIMFGRLYFSILGMSYYFCQKKTQNEKLHYRSHCGINSVFSPVLFKPVAYPKYELVEFWEFYVKCF